MGKHMLKLNFLSLSLALSVFMNCMAVSLPEIKDGDKLSIKEYLEKLAALSYIKDSNKISILERYFSVRVFPHSLTPQFIYDKIVKGAELLGFEDDHTNFLNYVVSNSSHGSLDVFNAIDELQKDIKNPAILRRLQERPYIKHKLLPFYAEGRELQKKYILYTLSNLHEDGAYLDNNIDYLTHLARKIHLQNTYFERDEAISTDQHNFDVMSLDLDQTLSFIKGLGIISEYPDVLKALENINSINRFQKLVEMSRLSHVWYAIGSTSFEEDYRYFLKSMKESIPFHVSNPKDNLSFSNKDYIEDKNFREQILKILEKYTQGIEKVITSDAADKNDQIEALNTAFEQELNALKDSIYKNILEEKRRNFERGLFNSVIENPLGSFESSTEIEGANLRAVSRLLVDLLGLDTL
jgi:hypothetical protein